VVPRRLPCWLLWGLFLLFCCLRDEIVKVLSASEDWLKESRLLLIEVVLELVQALGQPTPTVKGGLDPNRRFLGGWGLWRGVTSLLVVVELRLILLEVLVVDALQELLLVTRDRFDHTGIRLPILLGRFFYFLNLYNGLFLQIP